MVMPEIASGIPFNATVGVASSVIVSSSPYRKGIVITNISDTRVYLARGDNAVLNAGISLNAAGGVFIDQVDNLGRIYTGPYAAISTAGAKNLAISEDR